MSWIPIYEVNWEDNDIIQFHIDTRDFGVSCVKEGELPKELNVDIIQKSKKLLYTIEEVKESINRLFTESKGKNNWRMLSLISSDPRVKNWAIKYLRVYKVEKGYIICNSNNKAIPSDILSCSVDLKYLAAH